MSHEFTNAHATTVHINKMFGYMSSVLHVLNTDHLITAMLHADYFATQSSQVAFYSESVLNFFFFSPLNKIISELLHRLVFDTHSYYSIIHAVQTFICQSNYSHAFPSSSSLPSEVFQTRFQVSVSVADPCSLRLLLFSCLGS